MKKHFKQQISKWISNRKGSGEVALILLLMILGLFFLTKFVFKIPFPFTENTKTDTTINETIEDNTSKE